MTYNNIKERKDNEKFTGQSSLGIRRDEKRFFFLATPFCRKKFQFYRVPVLSIVIRRRHVEPFFLFCCRINLVG